MIFETGSVLLKFNFACAPNTFLTYFTLFGPIQESRVIRAAGAVQSTGTTRNLKLSLKC